MFRAVVGDGLVPSRRAPRARSRMLTHSRFVVQKPSGTPASDRAPCGRVGVERATARPSGALGRPYGRSYTPLNAFSLKALAPAATQGPVAVKKHLTPISAKRCTLSFMHNVPAVRPAATMRRSEFSILS